MHQPQGDSRQLENQANDVDRRPEVVPHGLRDVRDDHGADEARNVEADEQADDDHETLVGVHHGEVESKPLRRLVDPSVCMCVCMCVCAYMHTRRSRVEATAQTCQPI
jgi:hypothetical protein